MITLNEKVGRRFIFPGKVRREVVEHMTFRGNAWFIEFPDGNGTIIATTVLGGRLPELHEIKTMVSELFAPFGAEFCTLLAGAFRVQFLSLLGEPVPSEMDI